ncbi:MAG: low specificity L-threonine aldolase [Bdellovibrionales bacterium]|nr:low specificity L-threonine aldolase [Bdellovibrionales bacterium]
MVKSLGSDNHSGIHPEILEALIQTNYGHSPSYGTDELTEEVYKIFKSHFGEKAETFFVFNGTAANVLSIKCFLKSFESVLCAADSHLNLDECGAPEAISGCKLIPLPSPEGKITVDQCREALIRLGDQHYSQPKMVSITQPTELGTLYSYEEMKALSQFCKENSLYFHIDGARFIHAAHQLNKSFKELTQDIGVDVLSFGGTKNGLLYGEAVIVFSKDKIRDLKFYRKQCLQLPSKMRFLSTQFKALLDRDLWRKISQKECELASYLAEKVASIPEVKVFQKVQANSVFVKLPKEWVKPLRNSHFFYIWNEKDWSARWMMSFDTEREDLDEFVNKILELRGES